MLGGGGGWWSQCTQLTRSRAGTIAPLKYVYYGKHSEGNRFIRNDDL
jgi:hypothetical protein